jgi:hypothetical protein
MIINKLKIKTEKEWLIISSLIEFKTRPDMNDTLEYQIPIRYKKYISKNLDQFLVGLMMIAMHLNEDIIIKGSISPKLINNLYQYQNYFYYYVSNLYKKVKIIPEEIKIEKPLLRINTISFSGGVDSYYSLFNNLNNEDLLEQYKISHLLFSDSRNSNNRDFRLKKINEISKKINMKCIIINTNIRDFYKKTNLPKHLYHPLVFIGSMLNLSRMIKIHYFPSTFTYLGRTIWGTNVITDHLLSNDNTEIIHENPNINRSNKTKKLIQYKETYDDLYVCNNEEFQNCCSCYKCLRTMITQKVFNIESSYKKSFKKLSHYDIFKWVTDEEEVLTMIKEILYYSKRFNNKLYYELVFFRIIRFIIFIPLRKIYKISAYLKKQSKLYSNLIKYIKKGL